MDCWYCPFHSKNKENVQMFLSENTWKNLIKYIEAQDKELLSFMFTGGEPTLHPMFKKYVVEIYNTFKDKIKIQVNTNLGKDISYYKEEFPDVPMEVLATYHSDYVSDINNFFEKIDFLEKTKTVRTHLMLEEKNIELIKDIYMSRKNRYNTSDLSGVDVVPIHSFEKNRAFHDIDWFDKNKRHFGYLENEVDSSCVVPLVDGYKDNRYFKGMLCTGENIVDPNGDVYHCYQDVISKRVKLNLCERNLKKQQDVKICLNTQCNDGFFFPKYSVKHYSNRG